MTIITFDAPIVGIDCETRWTEFTASLVVLHHAGRVARTGLAVARILALVMDARLGGWTAAVLQTDGHRGVAIFCTNADRLVLQNLAFFVDGAYSGLVAGVLARVVPTGLVGGALAVGATFDTLVWACELSVLVDDQTVLAPTGRLVIGDRTFLVEIASGGGAGVDASLGLFVAGSVAGTVDVSPTAPSRLPDLRLGVAPPTRPAPDMRPANITLGTLAPGFVQNHIANCVMTAGGS